MDYKKIWESKVSEESFDAPVTVWKAQTEIFIGRHRAGYTDVLSLSRQAAREMCEAILSYLEGDEKL